MNSFTSFASVLRSMRLFARLLSIPAALGFMAPMAVEAGGGDHKGHHDHHDSHMKMGDSYPSTMFMGKTTFVLGGVDGVSDSGMDGMDGMGGMSSSGEKDGTVFLLRYKAHVYDQFHWPRHA